MPVPQEIADYVQEIDNNFKRAVENRVSRMDITWGKWSRDLNLRMRARQNETEDPVKSLLIWCFMYWINRSELLELNFKYKFTHKKQRKELEEMGTSMRTIIMSGDPMGPPGQDDQIKALLNQVGLEFNKGNESNN